MSLDEARSLIQQNRIYEAFSILQKLRMSPNPPEGVWLEWAGLARTTPFTYLALDAARKEFELFKSPQAMLFVQSLEEHLRLARERSSKEYPPISLIAIAQPGCENRWMRCIDSLSFQFNSKVDLTLLTDVPAEAWGKLPPFVSLRKITSQPFNQAAEYAAAIQAAPGEIISVVEDPSTIFGDHGLIIIGAAFKTVASLVIAQSERLCYGLEGVATPIRFELPIWNQSILLDPICVSPPSLYFSWRGTYFRKKILLDEGLPFGDGVMHATAFDAAVKIARKHVIHSVRAPVVLDESEVEARSFKVPIIEAAEAIQIIKREKKLLTTPPSTASSEIIEIAKKTYNFHTFPKIAPFIITHGERVAPLISIVTAVYNGRDYLERCIDSILGQNYPNLEYMILDGGSTDGSQEIIKKYEKQLAFWRSTPDGGHYAAVQDGLLRSKGSLMTWLNADDFLAPYTFRLVASIFNERQDIHWITGKFCMTSDQNDLDISIATPLFPGDNYFDDAFDRPFIQQEGTFWRRSLWERAGGSLDLRLDLAADMELWTRFFQHTQLHTLSVPLGAFMRRKGQRSELFQNRYYHEAYSIIQNLKAANIRPYRSLRNESTRLEIPLE